MMGSIHGVGSSRTELLRHPLLSESCRTTTWSQNLDQVSITVAVCPFKTCPFSLHSLAILEKRRRSEGKM